MFKYVEDMRREAFRLCSKAYGARNKETNEAMYDLYPLKRLIKMLCFEDADEARAACAHYNITVQGYHPSKSQPDLVDYVIKWRQTSFKEARHPTKGTVLKLKPRKMIRTIEVKTQGATRLAICRGIVSMTPRESPAKSVSASHSKSATSTPPQIAPVAATVSVPVIDQQRDSPSQPLVEAEEKEKAHLRAEYEQRKAEEHRKRKEAEKEKLRKEEAHRREEEARLKEEARKQSEEAEHKRRQEEEERKRRKENEERQRKAEEERRRKEQLEMERQRELERQREVARLRELERQRQLEVLRQKKQQEEKERLRKVVEEAQKKRNKLERESLDRFREWQEKSNAIRRQVAFLRLYQSIPQRDRVRAGISNTHYALAPSRSFLAPFPQKLVAEESAMYYTRDSSFACEVSASLNSLLSVQNRMPIPGGIRNIASQFARETAASDHLSIGDPGAFLLKVAVLFPRCASAADQGLVDLFRHWVKKFLQFGTVHVEHGNNAEVRLVFVDGTGTCVSEQTTWDSVIVVAPCTRPLGDWTADEDEYLRPSHCSVLLVPDQRTVTNQVLSSIAKTFKVEPDELRVCTGSSGDPEQLKGCLQDCATAACDRVDPLAIRRVHRVSVFDICSLCIDFMIWNREADFQDELMGRIRKEQTCLLVSIGNCLATLVDEPPDWPPREFVTVSGGNVIVPSYFSNGADLPVSWRVDQERVVEQWETILRLFNSLGQAIEYLLQGAPYDVKKECSALHMSRHFRRCLQRALHWRKQYEQTSAPPASHNRQHVILPTDLLRAIIQVFNTRIEEHEVNNLAPADTKHPRYEESGERDQHLSRAPIAATPNQLFPMPPRAVANNTPKISSSSKRQRDALPQVGIDSQDVLESALFTKRLKAMVMRSES